MTVIHPAPLQLADLAAVMRPDWNRAHLEGAVAGARQNGWSWPRVFAEVARLLVQDDSSPRDLTEAAREPLNAPSAPASPELQREWAATCREFLAIRNAS